MMTAITVSQGRVSPVFDVSREATIVEFDSRKVVATFHARLLDDLDRKAHQLQTLGVDTLVCGAISSEALRSLCGLGIKVISFVTGDVGAVVAALATGNLPNEKLTMPGCACPICVPHAPRRVRTRRRRAAGSRSAEGKS